MVIHYVSKEHINYPRSACNCNLLLSPLNKTNDVTKVTCKACLKNLNNNSIPKDIQSRRGSFSKKSEKINFLKEKNKCQR
jgi:hypothetical protein